jgi:hypothetical protein
MNVAVFLSCSQQQQNTSGNVIISDSDSTKVNSVQDSMTIKEDLSSEKIKQIQNTSVTSVETNKNISSTKPVKNRGELLQKESNIGKSEDKKPSLPLPKAESVSQDQLDKYKNNKGSDIVKEEPVIKIKANYSLYNSLLQKYVSSTGAVNYFELKKEMKGLEEFISGLSNDPVFEKGSRNEKLAFWINVYNANTLLMVIQNYPLKSIRDIYKGNPWDVKWIRIGNRTYSLNQIENDIIRPEFKEPRIHFVLNCAAKSCPPLYNKVITKDNLESVLESTTKKFITGSENKIGNNKLEISSIFDWYRDDFGDITSFISTYSGVKISKDAKITYKKYDWRLNGE